MTLEEQVLGDFKEAMKARDQLRSTALSFLRAQFSYMALEKKKDKLDDADCLVVIKKLIKQRQDSIEQFEKGGRADLAEKVKKELAILKGYLPSELPVEAVRAIVEESVAACGALGMKDMGKVMKEVSARTQGKADNKVISELVRERLNKA